MSILNRIPEAEYPRVSQPSYEECARAQAAHRALQHAPTKVWSAVEGKGFREFAYDYAAAWQAAKAAPQIYLHIGELEEKMARMAKMLELHTQEIAELKAERLDEPKVPAPDEYDTWASSTEAAAFAGLYVAFVPGLKVIASAPTLEELMPVVDAHPRGGEANIDVIPRGDC